MQGGERGNLVDNVTHTQLQSQDLQDTLADTLQMSSKQHTLTHLYIRGHQRASIRVNSWI